MIYSEVIQEPYLDQERAMRYSKAQTLTDWQLSAFHSLQHGALESHYSTTSPD